MWVHWAHRISTTPLILHPPAPTPPADSTSKKSTRLSEEALQFQAGLDAGHIEKEFGEADCVAGLDFVEGWSPPRIAVAIFMAVLVAVAAALLWIFLGVSPHVVHSGVRDAGERVASGCLVGVFTLLVGLAAVAGWIGISWLVD
jgi:hypothetical protein